MKSTLIYMSVLAGTLLACSHSTPASGQTPTPVRWTVAPVHTALKAGTVAKVRIDASIQTGWHIYSITQPAGGPIATRITVPVGQPFVAAGDAKPTVPPHVSFDEEFKMNVQQHEKAVGFDVPVRFTGQDNSSADSVRVNVRYQVCNATLCLPPQTAKLAAPVVATKGR